MKTQRLFIEDGVLDLREHYKVKKPKETATAVQKEYLTKGIKRLALSFQQANTLKETSLQEKKKIWERERSMVDPRFRRVLSTFEMEELKNKHPSSDSSLIKDEMIPSAIKKSLCESPTKTPKRVTFDMSCNIDKTDKPELANKTERPEVPDKTEKVIERKNEANKTEGTDNFEKTLDKPDRNQTRDKTKEPHTPNLTVKPAVTNIPKMIDNIECNEGIKPTVTTEKPEPVQPSGTEMRIKPGVCNITEPVQPSGTVDQLVEKLHKVLNDASDETSNFQSREVVQSSGDSNMYDCEDFICDYNIQYQPFVQYRSTYDPLGDHDLLRNVDPRLRKKYSVLNVPKSFASNSGHGDRVSDGSPDIISFQKSYDNESIDSYYYRESQEGIPSNVSYSRRVVSLMIGFTMGLLLMSVLVNLIYNSEVLPVVFRMKQKKDHSLTSYVKYFAGGLIHFVATFFQSLGRLLSIPTQHVYAPKPEYHRWPINPLNL